MYIAVERERELSICVAWLDGARNTGPFGAAVKRCLTMDTTLVAKQKTMFDYKSAIYAQFNKVMQRDRTYGIAYCLWVGAARRGA